jgi:hypothetical protein
MLRDHTGSASAPITFAGISIAAPILALAAFRRLERG